MKEYDEQPRSSDRESSSAATWRVMVGIAMEGEEEKSMERPPGIGLEAEEDGVSDGS